MFPIKLIWGISTKGYYQFDMTKPQLDLRTSNDVKFWLFSYRFRTSIKLKLNWKWQMFLIKLILGIQILEFQTTNWKATLSPEIKKTLLFSSIDDNIVCLQLADSAIASKTQMVIAQQTTDIFLTHCGNEARQSNSHRQKTSCKFLMTSPNLLPSSTHNILWMQFENHFWLDKGRTCKIYHDGVDFECFNRPNPENQQLELRAHPFDPSHKSHKFRGLRLQCGISTCIQTGEIVSCHGPFHAGEWHDLTICRRCVEPLLAPGEMVEADAGCRGDKTTQQPKDHCCRSEKMAKKKAARRHEAANGSLENFRCLHSQFRHNTHEHKHDFHTSAVVTHLMLRQHGQLPVSCQNKVIVFIKSDLQTCVVAATMFDEQSSDFTDTQSDWGWSDWTWSWTTPLTATWP